MPEKKRGASATNSFPLGSLLRIIRKYRSRMFNHETVALRLTKGRFVHIRPGAADWFFKLEQVENQLLGFGDSNLFLDIFTRPGGGISSGSARFSSSPLRNAKCHICKISALVLLSSSQGWKNNGTEIALKSLLSNRNVARYGIRRISAIQRPRAIFFPWELVSIGIRLNSQYEPCFVMLEQRKMGKQKKKFA